MKQDISRGFSFAEKVYCFLVEGRVGSGPDLVLERRGFVGPEPIYTAAWEGQAQPKSEIEDVSIVVVSLPCVCGPHGD